MPLTLYRRGRIWHYRGSVASRRLRGSTKTASREVAERVVHELEAREWKGRLDGPSAILTFAEAAMLYRRAGKPDRFLRLIEDHWKDTPVKQMTPGAIRQSAVALCPAAGAATRNRHVIVPTQAIINYAAGMEMCQRIRVPRFPVQKREKIPATWEWIQSFMVHAQKRNLAALACFMFMTGARISEALAVRWEDIDFGARRVLIRQTKVGAERRPHMQPELVAALASLKGEREGSVFSFKSRSNIKTQWEGAIRRAGIKRLTPHACRHGFATTLLQRGIDPVTVAKLGGWATPAHVFATYGHAMDDDTVVDLITSTPETHAAGKRNAANGI